MTVLGDEVQLLANVLTFFVFNYTRRGLLDADTLPLVMSGSTVYWGASRAPTQTTCFEGY
eukprot:2681505-Amphidinium_carterae.1